MAAGAALRITAFALTALIAGTLSVWTRASQSIRGRQTG